MFPYRVWYTESESDIKNYNFLYKNTKKAKTLSKNWKFWEFFKNPKFSKTQFFIWHSVYVPQFIFFTFLHFLCFYVFVCLYMYIIIIFYIFVYLFIYICIYYYIVYYTWQSDKTAKRDGQTRRLYETLKQIVAGC